MHTHVHVHLYIHIFIPEPSELIFQCDFENEFCGVRQVSSMSSVWGRNRGSTRSSATGPDNAYSGSYYVFVESSDKQDQNVRYVTLTVNHGIDSFE